MTATSEGIDASVRSAVLTYAVFIGSDRVRQLGVAHPSGS
jgi:hypothetical protein